MIEVLKQLVDALENHSAIKHPQQIHYRDAAIEVGKQAIAELESQEPVAYLCEPDENGLFGLPTPDKGCKDCFPVYRHPQRTWVGLTDDEIEKVWQNVQTSDFHDCVQPFTKAIEAKLKQKNI
jgi:hypothetical protein